MKTPLRRLTITAVMAGMLQLATPAASAVAATAQDLSAPTVRAVAGLDAPGCARASRVATASRSKKVRVVGCGRKIHGVRGAAVVVRGNTIYAKRDGVVRLPSPNGGYAEIVDNRILPRRRPARAGQVGVEIRGRGGAVIEGNRIARWKGPAVVIGRGTAERTPARVKIARNRLASYGKGPILVLPRVRRNVSPLITVRSNTFGRGVAVAAGRSAVFVRSESVRKAALAAGNESARGWIVWLNNRRAGGKTLPPPGGWDATPASSDAAVDAPDPQTPPPPPSDVDDPTEGSGEPADDPAGGVNEDAEGHFDPLTYDYGGMTGRTDKDAPLSLLRSGPHVINTAGSTLSGVTTVPTNKVEIIIDRAAGVQIDECVLAHMVRVYDHNSKTAQATVERCDLAVVGNGMTGLSLIARHNYITSTNDGITPTGGAHGPRTILEYNKIERDGSIRGDKHHDGIQFWQGGNALIRRNWISGWHTSAILIKSDLELRPGDGPVSNITIEENYLANPTGYYSLYVRDGGRGRPRFITIQNNAFGPGTPISSGANPGDQATFVRTEAERDNAIRNGDVRAAEWIVWSGNYDARTGQEIAPPGGWYNPPTQ